MNYLSTITLFILALSFTFSQTVTADGKHKAPSRTQLEEMFGKPVDCDNPFLKGSISPKSKEQPQTNGLVCFVNKRSVVIKVEFNSSKRAKRISIFSDVGQVFWSAVEILLLNGRGKLIKKVDKLPEGDCDSNFIEEYESLSMEYYSKGCQGSMPGSVIITWK